VTDASHRDAPRPPGTIVTTGTGRVSVEPDIAELRLGVAIGRPTVGEARAAAAEAMTAILSAVSGAGVERRNIRTSTLSIQPRYDYRDGKPPTLTGYDLANVVAVTVRDLARLGDVIDGALGAGATSLDGLTFRVDDPRAAEHEARTAAVAEARERAEVLAAAAGVAIAGVHDIVEAGAVPVWPQPKAARAMLASDAGTPVEGGTTEIAVTVSVTFHLG
jgi:uncharacterized protein YggE